MAEATYNTIGKTYDNTRKPDPEITKKLIELLRYKVNGRYLDMGCGSGNYTGALAQNDLHMEGIDISTEMLSKARKKHPHIIFHQGDAKALPFQENTYDGAICIFATHHIGNNSKIFQEAFRIIKNDGRFVIFTATPEQISHYWLSHYFPKMIANDRKKMASFNELKHDLEQAGFNNIQQSSFFITNQLQDWFLCADKYRPEIYLDATVRQGISSFHLSANPIELEQGLKQLRIDIESGKIRQIIETYENNLGECLFVVGEKTRS